MGLQIIQIPTNASTTYTGTSIYDQMIPINWQPIAPVSVQLTDDISGFFKYKVILRVYKDSVSSSNLLATLKQRPNNASTTTNSVALFDIKGIVNTQLQSTFFDANDTTESIHGIGINNNSKIFSKNYEQVQTIVIKATYEKATSSTTAPIEETTGYVQISFETTRATFNLFNSFTNPLDNGFVINGLTSSLLTDNNTSFDDLRKLNKAIGGGSLLSGEINYITKNNDNHTIAFINKNAYNSEGNYMCLKYYSSNGGQIGNTYTFENASTQGGEPPASANSDDEYIIYAGCGSLNLNGYGGACFKNGVATAVFDGQPAQPIYTNYSYYTIYLSSDDAGATRKSKIYYFVRQFDSTVNCKDISIIRLAWTNSLGAWDYYNFNAGQTETIETERMNYGQLLGTPSLDTGTKYAYYNWQGGTRTLYTKPKLKSRLQTQYILEEESQFLESLFKSNNVIILTGQQQSVVVTNKSFERKTIEKDKLFIQYTFDIEYSNELNSNS